MKNNLSYLFAILITWAIPLIALAQGTQGLRDLANKYYDQAVIIAFPIAIIVLIFAGYKYITSAGNPETLGEAKAMISGALIGLLLLLLAGLVVRTIGFQTSIR